MAIHIGLYSVFEPGSDDLIDAVGADTDADEASRRRLAPGAKCQKYISMFHIVDNALYFKVPSTGIRLLSSVASA